jgi:RHS repeat-associated protein
VSGAATAAFTYDGDGNRVKSVVGATTSYFVGSHYESSGGVVTKYYLAGGTRVAMRKGSTFYCLLSDHLGSTSKVATSTGTLHSQQLYKAWGESRYTSGTLPTRYTYTGQYSYASDFGLVYYGSRFYDPLLARWASPIRSSRRTRARKPGTAIPMSTTRRSITPTRQGIWLPMRVREEDAVYQVVRINNRLLLHLIDHHRHPNLFSHNFIQILQYRPTPDNITCLLQHQRLLHRHLKLMYIYRYR